MDEADSPTCPTPPRLVLRAAFQYNDWEIMSCQLPPAQFEVVDVKVNGTVKSEYVFKMCCVYIFFLLFILFDIFFSLYFFLLCLYFSLFPFFFCLPIMHTLSHTHTRTNIRSCAVTLEHHKLTRLSDVSVKLDTFAISARSRVFFSPPQYCIPSFR